MGVVVILLAASLTVAVGFLLAFLWAVRRGQFDDLETPSVRILCDDDRLNDSASDLHPTATEP